MRHIMNGLLVGALVIYAAGCRNPAEGKSKAEVGEAKPIKKDSKPRPVEAVELTPKNTKIGWVGSKVTGSHTGDFKKFTGSVETLQRTAETTHIRVDIDMNSVTSDNPKLTGHLKSKDFFWVSKYPRAKFVSTSIRKGGKKGATHTVTGNLTLRGVTKSIAFPATIELTEKDVAARARRSSPGFTLTDPSTSPFPLWGPTFRSVG
jgi:polyisoprenoid-binding protein YceI